MATNDVVQFAVRGNVGGQQHVHTLHFRYQTDLATEQALIDAWQASAVASYRACFNTDYDTPVVDMVARQVAPKTNARAAVEETQAAGSQAGTRIAFTDRLPAVLACTVSVRTALAGRSNRGRFFLSGLREDDLYLNEIGANYLNLVQAYVNALLGAFGPSGTNGDFRLAVFSRKRAITTPDSPLTVSNLVQGMIVRNQINTMRSRKLGSGS